MQRQAFTFDDLSRECEIRLGHRHIDGRAIGIEIRVPGPLQDRYPFNASAYAFLQQLRQVIDAAGLIEFPELPVNRTNHTLAQRAPWEHSYSSNPYLTDICQSPHQDTPPFPTAFWLGASRQFFATWLISDRGLAAFVELSKEEPGLDIDTLHRRLVPATLTERTGLLINRSPGLVLLSNGAGQKLYHARTCNFAAVAAAPESSPDTPMYAYNEMGLLQYMDSLDSRRGEADRDPIDLAEVKTFLAAS